MSATWAWFQPPCCGLGPRGRLQHLCGPPRRWPERDPPCAIGNQCATTLLRFAANLTDEDASVIVFIDAAENCSSNLPPKQKVIVAIFATRVLRRLKP